MAGNIDGVAMYSRKALLDNNFIRYIDVLILLRFINNI